MAARPVDIFSSKIVDSAGHFNFHAMRTFRILDSWLLNSASLINVY